MENRQTVDKANKTKSYLMEISTRLNFWLDEPRGKMGQYYILSDIKWTVRKY